MFKEHVITENNEHTDTAHHAVHALVEPAESLRRIKTCLRTGRQDKAYAIAKESVLLFPNEPVFLSYYGYLLALEKRMYRRGVEACQKAIKAFQINGSFDEEALYPLFYYNLSKAYSTAGKKKEARETLRKGLSYSPGNNHLMKELRSLGMRSDKPPLAFLRRSNPLNKYIGIMLHKGKKLRKRKRGLP
jgi:tetratricopeptide (TPR) repeat protein